MITLKIGQRPPEGTELIGWQFADTKQPCPPETVAGYRIDYYFRNGAYLGPDVHGVEPVFTAPPTSGGAA